MRVYSARGKLSEMKIRASSSDFLSQDYIKQMIDVLTMAEDMESLDSLHALCSLMQTIRGSSHWLRDRLVLPRSVMLNDHSMYEHIVEDDIFLGVVGMLECTFISFNHIPTFPTLRLH